MMWRKAQFAIRWLPAAALLWCVGTAGAQVTVDRIVARIEGDILTLSDVREMQDYARLVDGSALNYSKALDRRIDLWILQAELESLKFPPPTEAQVNAEFDRLRSRFASPQEFAERLAASRMTEESLRQWLAFQLHLVRFLDYRFRPFVEVTPGSIESYYRERLRPELERRGESAPPLEEVREQIQELLTLRQVDERAEKWLAEVRTRTRIEILVAEEPR